MRLGIVALVALVLGAGCSFKPGSVPADARPIDAPPITPDAGATARRAADVIAGGGRTKAGAITIDVEIGQGVQVRSSKAGTKTITGAAVIQP